MTSKNTSSSPSVLNILKEWDEQTQVTDSEQLLLDKIQSSLLKSTSIDASTTTATTTKLQSAEEDPVHSVQSFYSLWCNLESSPIQSTFEDEDVEKRDYVNKLITYKSVCQDLIQQVGQTMELCDQLQSNYKHVCQKTGTLHEDCEKLVMEKEELSLITDGIKQALDHFDDFEEFSVELNTASSSINVNLFSESLKRLDDSLSFLLNHQEYKEAKIYISKYRILQSRALAQLRDHVLTVLRNASYNVQNQVAKTGIANFSAMEEVQTLHIDFRMAIETLQPIIHEIELRAKRKEYTVFTMDCFDCYAQQRTYLVSKMIQFRINRLIEQRNLVDYVRQGCTYMIKVCSEEDQLFSHFFSSDEVRPGYKLLIESFCDVLYEGLRTLLVHENRIDVLCDLIEILRNEALGEGVKPKGLSASAFEPVVHHMIQDVQERLIYRTSSFISDCLRVFKPTPEELNYPEFLSHIDPDDSDKFHNYFPTLSLTVSILDKLYQSVDVEVFEGFAQEAVSICTNSFIDASKKISERKGIIDGELFLIRHLKELNTQISSFGVTLSRTETSLDFSQMQEGMLRFLKGQATFRVSSLIFDIMSQSRPRIVHTNVDSKKDLEDQLRHAYESFILNISRTAFDPCMTMIKRLSASKDEIPDTSEMMTMQDTVNKLLPDTLKVVSGKLPLYVTDETTQKELTHAIKFNIISLYDQLLKLVELRFAADDEQKRQVLNCMWEKKDLEHVVSQYLP